MTNRFIRLDPTTMDNPGAVGLTSRNIEIRHGETFFLGMRMRNNGGTPHLILAWMNREKSTIKAIRRALTPLSKGWEIHHLFTVRPSEAAFLRLVLINRSEKGAVDFDDLFLIELEGLD